MPLAPASSGRPRARSAGCPGRSRHRARSRLPRPGTGVFERLRAMPDHRVIDRLLRGRVWICFVGLALMGIVAMQVSLLKLNSGIGRAVETTSTLERQNSQMEADIARLASGERIRAAADRRGMVTPAAGEVHFLHVRPGRDAARAVRRMRAPSDAARELMANAGVAAGSLAAAPTTASTEAVAPVVTPAPTRSPRRSRPPRRLPSRRCSRRPTATAPSSGGTVAATTPPQG